MASNGFNITPEIRLEGVSEFRKQITAVNNYVKTMSSEIRANTSSLGKNADSYKNVIKNGKNLESIYEAQKTKLDVLNKEYEKSVKETGEFSNKSLNLKNQINNQSVAVQKAKNNLDSYTTSTEYLTARQKEADNAVKDAKDKLAQLTAEYKTSIKEAGKTSDATKELKNQVDAAKDELKQAKIAAKEAGDAVEESGKQAEKSSDGFTVMKGAVANLVADGIRMTISALKDFSKEVVNVGMGFDSSMSQVAAVSGAAGDELEALRDKAKEMGSSTKFTASETADAFNYMAMAGWKTEDMLNGIEGILNLAAAANTDLATTSDIVTDSLTAMGYSAGDAGRLADVMAAASSNANTNIEMMGATFKYAAPIIGAMKYSMEDAAVAIGLMANAGIKGEQAGTALRSILSRLAAPPKEAADAMSALGISIKNTDGSMKPLNEVIEIMRQKFDGLSESQQTQYAKSLAGTEAMSGLLAIVNASETDFNKLTDAVNSSNGAAEKMAETMQDNLGGDLTKLSSQFEGVQIAIYEKMEPALRKGVKALSDLTNRIDWDEFGREVEKALDKVIDGFEWIVDHKSLVVGAMKLFIAALAISKVNSWTKSMSDAIKKSVLFETITNLNTAATNTNTTATNANRIAQIASTAATKGLTAATTFLNTAWKDNPVGLIVTGITALITLYTALKGKTNELTEAEKAKQQAYDDTVDRVNESVKSWNDLKQAQQNSINTGMTEMANYQNLYKELQNITDENGRVKDGYEKRAQFIVTTLNDALGTEISITNGVIDKYGELSKSIDDLIKKKQAEIVINSQEETYAKAKENLNTQLKETNSLYSELSKKQSELNGYQKKAEELENKIAEANKNKHFITAHNYKEELRMVDAAIKGTQKEVDEKQANYDKSKDLLSKYYYEIGQYDTNYKNLLEGNYEEISNIPWDIAKNYQGAGEAEKKYLEDQKISVEGHLNYLKQLRDESNTTIYDDQIAAYEKQLAGLNENLTQYESATKEGLKYTEIDWNVGLAGQLSAINGKNVEFKYAGNGLVQKYVDGIAEGEPMTRLEAERLAQEAIKKVYAEKGNAEGAGKNLASGVGTGIEDAKTQQSVFKKVANFAKSVLNKLKSAFKEHSPSKATNEMGQNLLLGISLGIKKQAAPLLNQVSSFGKDVMSNLQGELSNGLEVGNVKSNLQTNLSNARNNSSGYSSSNSSVRDGNGNAGRTITQNITVISPEPLNPTDTAREIEKINRQLAFEI